MFSYRDNLEWLARATNWAKFTATASLGVIHKVIYTYLCEQASEQKQLFGVKEQKIGTSLAVQCLRLRASKSVDRPGN